MTLVLCSPARRCQSPGRGGRWRGRWSRSLGSQAPRGIPPGGGHLLFGCRGVRSGGERRSRHLPGTGAHVRGRWWDHTGLWGHRDFAGERVTLQPCWSPPPSIGRATNWLVSPAPSCTGGLPWDDYKGQWGSGLTAGGGEDYIGTTGDEAILSSGYTTGLHHIATLWATMGCMGYTTGLRRQ